MRQTVLFPMLRKELVERAARPRTYVVRCAYAFLFFAAFLYTYDSLVGAPQGTPESRVGLALGALGRGSEIFLSALVIQGVGIFLFLPAMMCGLITEEKERGTLPLLLLTPMGIPEAVLQKYFGGLIPMATLLLLTLPAGGFAYLMGGLSFEMVLIGVCALLMTACLVGAVALACSSYARTTIGAFIATYLVLVVLALLGPEHLFPSTRVVTAFDVFILFVVTSGAATCGALLVACHFFQSRSQVTSKAYLQRLFQALDRKFQRLNRHLGGIELVRDHRSLPEWSPILWREKHRRQLGKFRYQIRYFVAVESIVVLVAIIDVDAMETASFIAWGLGALLLTAQASNLLVSERLSQTLDVLLTTPLSGARMVQEKVQSLLPLAVVIAAPILTLAVIQSSAGWLTDTGFIRQALFLCHEILHVILFFPLFVAVGLAVGLGARSRLAAMMKSIGLIVGWSALPWLGFWVERPMETSSVWAGAALGEWWCYLGPSWMIMVHHHHPSIHMSRFLAYALAVGIYALVTILIFRGSFAQADQKLGRPA